LHHGGQERDPVDEHEVRKVTAVHVNLELSVWVLKQHMTAMCASDPPG
jgi:hypothetical protein